MEKIAGKIDHTLLRADASEEEIKILCQEAMDNSFAAVCVNPYYVELAAEILSAGKVGLATVVGFPLGASTSAVKAFETKNATENGANEIDMVINIGALKDGNYQLVKEDIEAVANVCKDKALLKLIIETSLLNEDEKIKACQLAVEAGVDYVKTSTGFSSGGALVEDVKLMKSIVGPDIGVKASGGIRDKKTALAMIEAGASRLGTSSGLKIIE